MDTDLFHFPSQAPENGFSPSLRSGETLHSQNTEKDSATLRRRSNDFNVLAERSAGEEQTPAVCKGDSPSLHSGEFSITSCSSNVGQFSKMAMFDIIILLGANDVEHLKKYVHYNQKNIQNYRNMYIVSYDPTIQIDGCITIDEN
jgi:hypothetical protein